MASISQVDSLGAALAAGKGKSGQSQEALDKTFNDFLVLLTTQLQHQDPTSPMETSEFTQQLASLSSVQEQVNTNKNLETLIGLVSGSQLNNVVSYIGRAIEADGNQGMLIEEGALFAYDLPQEAHSATITIMNSTGQAVYTGPALKNAGRNEVVWDGHNSFTGQKMPPGGYKFTISAKDSAGQAIQVVTHTTGIVTAVDTRGGEISLSLGQIQVPLNEVTAIRTAQELL